MHAPKVTTSPTGGESPSHLVVARLPALDDIIPRPSAPDNGVQGGGTSATSKFTTHVLSTTVQNLQRLDLLRGTSPEDVKRAGLYIRPETLLQCLNGMSRNSDLSILEILRSALTDMRDNKSHRATISRGECEELLLQLQNDIRNTKINLGLKPRGISLEKSSSNGRPSISFSNLSVQTRAELIVNLLNRDWIRYGRSFTAAFRDTLQENLAELITEGKRIPFALVTFADPVNLPLKKGQSFDLFDIAAVRRLADIVTAVGRVYPPGAEFYIFTGSSVYNRIFHKDVPGIEARSNAYHDAVKIFAEYFCVQDRIHLLDYPDVEKRTRPDCADYDPSLAEAWQKKASAVIALNTILPQSLDFAEAVRTNQEHKSTRLSTIEEPYEFNLSDIIEVVVAKDDVFGALFSKLFEASFYSTDQVEVEAFASRYSLSYQDVYLKLCADLERPTSFQTTISVFFPHLKRPAVFLEEPNSFIRDIKLLAAANNLPSVRATSVRGLLKNGIVISLLDTLYPGGTNCWPRELQDLKTPDELGLVIHNRIRDLQRKLQQQRYLMVQRGWNATIDYMVEYLSKQDSFEGRHIGGADVFGRFVPGIIRASTIYKRHQKTQQGQLPLLLGPDSRFLPPHASAYLRPIQGAENNPPFDAWTIAGAPRAALTAAGYAGLFLLPEEYDTRVRSRYSYLHNGKICEAVGENSEEKHDVAARPTLISETNLEDLMRRAIAVYEESSAQEVLLPDLEDLEQFHIDAFKALYTWLEEMDTKDFDSFWTLRKSLAGTDLQTFEIHLRKAPWINKLGILDDTKIAVLAYIQAVESTKNERLLRASLEDIVYKMPDFHACSLEAKSLYSLNRDSSNPLAFIPPEMNEVSLNPAYPSVREALPNIFTTTNKQGRASTPSPISEIVRPGLLSGDAAKTIYRDFSGGLLPRLYHWYQRMDWRNLVGTVFHRR